MKRHPPASRFRDSSLCLRSLVVRGTQSALVFGWFACGTPPSSQTDAANVSADAATVPPDAPTDATTPIDGSIVDAEPSPDSPPPPCGISPTPFALEQAEPNGITTDADYVYWTVGGTIASNFSNGKIVAAHKSGSPAVELATELPYPIDLEVDDQFVYWLNRGNTASDGGVWRVSKAGGLPVQLASAQHYPRKFTMDQDYLYWATTPTTGASKDAVIRRVPKSGGNTEDLIYGLRSIGALAVDDDQLYWSEFTGPAYRADKTSFVPSWLAYPNYGPTAMVPVGETLYIISLQSELYSIPKFGGLLTPLTPWTPARAYELVVRDGWAFWSGGNVRKVALSGGEPTTFGGAYSIALAVDEQCVYWTVDGEDDGSIWQSPK